MADFDRYSNYTEETSFSEIVYGADSPLLEVEMNEMQQILNTKMNRVIIQLGNSVYPLNEADYVDLPQPKMNPFTYPTITLKNCVVVAHNGLNVFVRSAKVTLNTLSSSYMYLYLRLHVKPVTFEDTLKSYGDTEGSNIQNKIMDDRYDNETSRRKVTEYTLMFGFTIPDDTDEYTYVNIGQFRYRPNGGTYDIEWNKVENLLSGAQKAAEQSLVNKDKIASLDRIGRPNYTYQAISDSRKNEYTVLEPDFERAFYADFGNDAMLDNKHYQISQVVCNLFLNLEDLSGTITERKRYKVNFNALIGECFLNNGKITIQNEGAISRKYSLELWGGKRLTGTPTSYYDVTNKVSIQQILFGPYTRYVGIIITIETILEFDEENKVWIPTEDRWTTSVDIANFNKDCFISAIRMGSILANYGDPDAVFDSLSQDYNNLIHKPQINDVTLQGNKTSEDLHIHGGSGTTNYEELENLPTFNGETLVGDVVESDPVYDGDLMTDEEVEDMLDEIFGEE